MTVLTTIGVIILAFGFVFGGFALIDYFINKGK